MRGRTVPHSLGRAALWRPEPVVTGNGSPSQPLRNHVRDIDVDLAVLGMHGRNAIPEPIAGSIVKTIMDDAPCDAPVIQELLDADARA
nr:universal stress protein [Azospirillum soli]